jgi:hypothetical protein
VSSYPRERMKCALWHAKAAIRSLKKAADTAGVDIDAPVEEPGLVPAPPDNPQSRASVEQRLRLVREYASKRYGDAKIC